MKIQPPGGEPPIEDRPLLFTISGGGVRLELWGNAEWMVELGPDDCIRIAEAIGYARPGIMRPADDSDS